MTTTIDQIEQLYVTYFGRPADVGGLQFWTQALTARPDILPSISREFAQASEYQGLYDGMTTAGRISYAYENMFGREPDQAGSAFWAKALDGGTIDFAGMVQAIAAGAQGSDRVALDSKVAAAGVATATLATDGPETFLAYAGGANENARIWLASIQDGASLAAATVPAAMGQPFLNALFANTTAHEPGLVYPSTLTEADLFMTYFGRLPTYDEQSHWADAVRVRPAAWLDNQMGRMAAFHDQYDSVPTANYINDLYLQLFDHSPSVTELSRGMDAISSGGATSASLPQFLLTNASAADQTLHTARVLLAATLLAYQETHGGQMDNDTPNQQALAKYWLAGAGDLATVDSMMTPTAIATEAQQLHHGGTIVTPAVLVGVPVAVDFHAG